MLGALLFAATLQIPAASGPLAIDGRLEEAIWRDARTLPLGEGGNTWLLVRGNYLCVAARLPEPDRVVAFSSRRDAALGREDLIAWRFDIRPALLTLSVTPLGGFRVESSPPAKGVIAAASIAGGAWTVEAAIPIESLAAIGFLSIERIRVPRPQSPEVRWHWPAVNERAGFELARAGASAEPPQYSPEPPGATPEKAPAASALAAAPGRLWSDADLTTTVEQQLRIRLANHAARERRDWKRVRTREDWEDFREPRLRALRASLGPLPERTPLRAAITRRASFGEGFVVENLVYESRPHLLVTANLYLPETISGRIPAVLVVHSHHAPKTQTELQDMGMSWARAGVAVLVPDQLGAGERLQSNPWPRESYYSRYALGMQLHLAGESLMQWMVWDLMRGIDLLLERPYIDPRRIVLIGAVAGGGDPAAVTAALDERVAAVIPFNFGEAGPEEHYLEGPRPYDFDTAWPGWGSWETTRNLWRSAADEFFPWFICASVAPRRFVYAFEIAWPKGVEQEPAWSRYRRVFDLYGEGDRLAEVHGFGPFPGPGECTNVGVFLRKQIYPILNQWLEAGAPAQEYHNPRPEAELMALTPALAADRGPKAASELALEIARQRLEQARARPAQLRSALAARLGDIEGNRFAPARPLWSRNVSGFTVQGMLLVSEPGIRIPTLFLKRAGIQGRLPAVIVFSQQGKERYLAERGAELETLLKAGMAVCLPDVRATGETAPGAGRGPGAMGPAATELMLGGTMVGAQLRDARTVCAYIRRRPDVDAGRILLLGDSLAPINPEFIAPYESIHRQLGPRRVYQAEPLGPLLALFTAVYEDGVHAVALRRGLASFLSVLEDRFCYVPLDAIVPGILEAGDISDIVALLRQPVLMEASVDGRNRPVAPPPASSRIVSWLIHQAAN